MAVSADPANARGLSYARTLRKQFMDCTRSQSPNWMSKSPGAHALSMRRSIKSARDAQRSRLPNTVVDYDKLGQVLGVQLLQRTTRHVTLTAVGSDCNRYVHELLGELDDTSFGIRGVAATHGRGDVCLRADNGLLLLFKSAPPQRRAQVAPKSDGRCSH